MRARIGWLLALVAVPFATGCSFMPHHSVTTHPALREHPIDRIYIFDPVMNPKVRRLHPDDFPEMQTAAAADSAAHLRDVLSDALSASHTVVSDFDPGRDLRDQARRISDGLSRDNVPASIEPMDVPASAVMLVGVIEYGTERDQWDITPIPIAGFKSWKIGSAKWDYICDLEVIVADPVTGRLLLDIRDKEEEDVKLQDASRLDAVTRQVTAFITKAIPPAPGRPGAGLTATLTGTAAPLGATPVAESGTLSTASATATTLVPSAASGTTVPATR